MFIVGVLCVVAAVSSTAFGVWSLSHAPTPNPTQLALRAMAPTQLAAGVMLAAGGVVALAAPLHTALIAVIFCVAGAMSTLAAGSWQSARYVLRRATPSGKMTSCSGGCAVCALSCP